MSTKYIQKGVVKEIVYSCIILSAYLLNGANRSYLAFLFHQLDSPGSSLLVNDEQKSWIAAFINLLSPLGCIAVGVMMDVYGRRISLQAIFVLFVVSWLMIVFSKNVYMFYTAALIQSISIGMSYSTSIYVSEISTADHRGALLGTSDILFNLGIFLCYLLMYYLKWSMVALITAVVSGIGLLLTFILPESPTWLYLKERKDESIATLIAIRCQDHDSIKHEIDDMENYISSQTKLELKQIIKNCSRSWKQFLIVLTMFILQKNTGYAILTTFIIMMVDRLKIPYQSTDVALIFSIACSISGFIPPYVMYKYNRKPSLTISAVGMSICAAVIPIYHHFFESYDEKPFAWVIPMALCGYIISCSVGVLPIGFTIGAELFPSEVRGVMNGLQGAVGYLYCSFLYKISPWYLTNFGASGMMWTFSGFSLLTALFALFVLPETKGKTLNEVQDKYFKKEKKNSGLG